jgi:alpha-tubulin suppressor-like RCC1 family protein
VAAGANHTFATKTDGTLWSWGYNTRGALGLNDTANRSSPVQVGALTTWYQIANGGGSNFTTATKTDGALWSWGRNNYGQLGLGDIVDRSSPVQVGALTTWYQVAAGLQHNIATKTDGTLWAWGYNAEGALGLANVVNRSSPVQVGLLTTWVRLSKMPMSRSSFALKTP